MKKRGFVILLLLLTAVALMTVTVQKPTVWSKACVGCGDCTHYCPTKAIHLEGTKAVIDHKKCINCKMCLSTCQYQAIR